MGQQAAQIRVYHCSVDYYRILRVSKIADRLEIKQAYRQLARDFHPDKKDGCLKSAEIFKEISVAHEILIDPASKKAYDKVRSSHLLGNGCQCKNFWTEEPELWTTTETGVVKPTASIACSCENCDPVKKERKEKERAESERKEKERKEKERQAREKAEAETKERMDKERADAERLEKEREELERRAREEAEAERKARAKQNRKKRISEQIELEHAEREEKRLKRIEELQRSIERKQEAHTSATTAGATPQIPSDSATASATEPEYSTTYWVDHDTKTPYYQSIQDDFDQAMALHKQTREQLPQASSLEEMDRIDEVIEARWKDMEAKSQRWAEASTVAQRLEKKAKGDKGSVTL